MNQQACLILVKDTSSVEIKDITSEVLSFKISMDGTIITFDNGVHDTETPRYLKGAKDVEKSGFGLVRIAPINQIRKTSEPVNFAGSLLCVVS